MLAKLLFGRGGPRGKNAGDGETAEGVVAASAGDPILSSSVWTSPAWAGRSGTRLFALLATIRSRRDLLVPAVATGGGTALALALGIFLSTAPRATPPGAVTATARPSFEDEFLKTSDRKSIPAVPPTLIGDDVTALLAEPPVEHPRLPLQNPSQNPSKDPSIDPPPAGFPGRRTGPGATVPPRTPVTASRTTSGPNHPLAPPGPPARGVRPALSPRLPPRLQPLAHPSDPDSVLPPTAP